MFNCEYKYTFSYKKFKAWKDKYSNVRGHDEWAKEIDGKEVQYRDSETGLVGRARVDYDWCIEVKR